MQREGGVVVGMLAALALGAVPRVGLAASDAALEERVRALEKKLDAEQKGAATESQSVRQRIEAIETQVKTEEQTIADKLGITFHAFVDTLAIYNTNSPANHNNQLRVFDVDSNSFELQQANINISRHKDDENLGFVINLDFGKEAEILNNATNWSNGSNRNSNTPFELREAYATYKLPFFQDITTLTFKGGKFVTLLGAEVVNNYDNFNYNISRSFSFGFGIPFTNTGLMTNFTVGSMVSVDAGVVNGWDNPQDNNNGKTFMGGVGFTPIDWYNFYLSGTYGPEENDNGHSKRGVFTWVNTLKPTDQLTLVAEATYGNESNFQPPNNPTQNSALWYGGCGYIVYKFTDRLQAAFRAEVFEDSDNFRVNVGPSLSTGLTPTGSTLWELTPTISYQVTQGLLWRNEYRHDNSNGKPFQTSSGNFVSGQDTLTTELIYVF